MGYRPPAAPGQPFVPVRFDALTEEWRLVGEMLISGRLSDALNRREAIDTRNVVGAPLGAEAFPTEPLGDGTLDPYELIAVLSTRESQPTMDKERQLANKIRKNAFDVVLICPPLRIQGRVHLFPGVSPPALLERVNELFIPVTNAIASVGDRRLDAPLGDLALVNHVYLKDVQQLDSRDLQAAAPDPEGAIGWDRVR